MFSLLFNKLDVNSFHCEVCQLAKHHCVLFLVSNTKSTFPFLSIHTDVRGPSRIPSLSGAMWFVSLIDDGTRGNRLYLMKNKSNVSSMFSIFHQMVSTQFIVKIKVIRFDNEKEFFNHVLSPFLEREGIIHQSSYTNSPQG